MEEKLLSIVVPVYKVEQYIDKCLSSLVLENPSLTNRLEVIIVNDGTPDHSAEMSREYVQRYPETFRQIDKENGGHGSAWNVGMMEAKGKYLRFLDSDDWFTNLDRLMNDLDQCDADIVFNPFIREHSDGNTSETVGVPSPQGTIQIDPTIWGTSYWGYNNVNFWAATYKTSILKPLYPLFAEKTWYDDFILIWAPLVHGRTYMSLDYPVYHYLIGREGQSVSKKQQRRGAISYAKCFSQYETVRSRISMSFIPEALQGCIDGAFCEYARNIFPYMIYLPYNSAQEQMSYLWRNYLADMPVKSKLLKRYAKMPGLVFYVFEHLRRRMNPILTIFRG